MNLSSATFERLHIDRSLGAPLHLQLSGGLRDMIEASHLAHGTVLPSSRSLAHQLAVSRNTVTLAYEHLTAEGYLDTRQGKGTWVCFVRHRATPTNRPIEAKGPGLSQRATSMLNIEALGPRSDPALLHPGYPDMRHFPMPAWTKTLKSHARQQSPAFFGYGDVSGHPLLKSAICSYLAQARGISCDPDQIVITTGTQAALDLISRVLIDPNDRFLIEDPGYPGAYDTLTTAGGVPDFLPVSSKGWHFDEIDQGVDYRAIFLTPSCQWPLSNVMRINERTRALKLAEKCNSWVIEDDYDSEYRFSAPPMPALFGNTKTNNVIYTGSFSKTMFPALRIGFVAAPKDAATALSRALERTGQYPPSLFQAALADFIAQGHFARHVRKMRNLYQRRLSIFLDMARSRLGKWLTFEEPSAGMQVIGRLQNNFKDKDVVKLVAQNGVSLLALSQAQRGSQMQNGLIFGFAGFDKGETRQGIEMLKRVLENG